jgi:hypothetical protein
VAVAELPSSLEQAFNVGNGRFQVVRRRVDERAQVRVGTREVRVALMEFVVTGGEFFVDGGQLLVEVLDLLAGPHLLRYVQGHAHDVGDVAGHLEDGLVDKGKIADFARRVPGQVGQAFLHGNRLARAPHLGQQLGVALRRQLRNGLGKGLAEELMHRQAQQLAHARVDHLHQVRRPVEHEDGHRSLLEYPLQLPLLTLGL